jgi:hypothetical protein
MKRIALFVLCASAFSINAFAQAPSTPLPTDYAARAVLAAPAATRDGATVIKWKSDFTYDVVKKGTNNMVCYDKSGTPEQQAIMIECTTTMDNLPRAAQNAKMEAGGDRKATQAMFDAAEKGGTRAKPVYGSVWYHLMGPDEAHLRTHMTIAVPGATAASTGLADNNKAGGVWVMNAGTTTAHLMTPGE